MFDAVVGFMLVVMINTLEYCEPYNCYELLNVSSSASVQQIKKAYREMAMQYHPDRVQGNQQSSVEFFQFINLAYEILSSERLRYKYNLFLQNPSESDYYREYRYYSENVQIPVSVVLLALVTVMSILEYIMKKHAHQSTVEGIVEGQDFKNRVNELAKGDKRKKEEIRNKLIGEIEIEGRYGPPKVKDLFGVRLIVGVWELVKYIIATVRWHWLYTVRKIEPLKEDESQMTRRLILRCSRKEWQRCSEIVKNKLIELQLWKQEKQEELMKIRNGKSDVLRRIVKQAYG